MDFVSRDALIAAMNAWVLSKHRPLAELLQERGVLTPAQRQALELVAAEHLKAHGDNAQKSLAAVGMPETLNGKLESLADADLHASVAAVGATLTTTAEERPAEEGLRYRVLRAHAQGGLGVVSVARDAELGREVAFKEIQARYAEDATLRGRFMREAEITGGLEHPGIVPVYGLGRYADGRPYYAMRLIRGESLEEAGRKYHAGEAGYTLRGLLTRFVAVCNAVAYAHSRGVIHRDLKPSNVMLGPYGETLVVDWGLAKVVGRESTDGAGSGELTLQPPSGEGSLTHAGSALGTPAYMSPEQARGEVADLGPDTDIYSLGATLYTVLTGQSPVQGRDAAEILEKVRQGNWPPPRQVKPSASKSLDAVCRKAMALEATDRYGTALELSADVERWLADEPVVAYREPWLARAGRWRRKHKTGVTAVAVAAAVTILLGGGGFVWQVQQQSRRRAAVEAALARTVEMQTAARWSEARAALDQAEDRLGEAGSPALRQRVEAARGDLELVASLDKLRIARASTNTAAGLFDDKATERGYDEVFARIGLKWADTDPDTAAAIVSRSAVRQAILAGLDDWAVMATGEKRARILDVARKVDPNPWRDWLRNPVVWDDNKALAKLFREVPVDELTPGLIAAVAGHGAYGGARAEAERLLRAAQTTRPDDFWLNYHLANLLMETRRMTEAEAFLRAALAVRPDSVWANIKLAWVQQDQGKLAEAEARYRKAIELDPKFAWAQNLLGWTLNRQDKTKEAEAFCRKAIELDPKLAAPHHDLAWILDRQGKAEEAEPLYRKAIELDPNYAVGHHDLGWALERQGKAAEAEALYRKAVELDPGYAPAHNNLGRKLQTRGKLPEAEALFRKAIDIDPKYIEAYHNLDALLERQGRLAEMEAVYGKTIDLDPKYPNARNDLGWVLERRGKLSEAETLYRLAVALDPKYALAYSNIGRMLESRGKLSEAEALFRKAIDIDPRFAAAYDNLDQLLARQGKPSEAEALFRKAIERDPGYANLHDSFGTLLQRRDKLSEAEAEYRKAIALDPKAGNPRSNLGTMLGEQGKLEEAIKLLTKAVALDPKDAGCRINLGWALERQGKAAEAEALFRKALELDPKNSTARENIAVLLTRRREWKEAETLLRGTIDLAPKSVTAYGKLGLVLEGQGKLDEAAAQYRKVIELDPKEASARGNLGTILARQGKLEEATELFQKAAQLDPKGVQFPFLLARALQRRGKLDEAAIQYRKVIELDPRNTTARVYLGAVLRRQSRVAEAEALYREAIKLNPKDVSGYINLGVLVTEQGKLNEAEALFRKATELTPEDSLPFANLADPLLQLGKIEKSLLASRKAVDLAAGFDSWAKSVAYTNVAEALLAQGQYPQAEEVARRALSFVPAGEKPGPEQEATLRQAVSGKRLTAILRGNEHPANTGETIDFAGLCRYQWRHADAARLYVAAFASDPKLADDLTAGHRYNAACSAVLAGCGVSKGSALLADREKERWRRQALAWLRADLTLRSRQMGGSPEEKSEALVRLQHSLNYPHLAGVRDDSAIAALSEAERKEWAAFWSEVKTLVAKGSAAK
jgi:tetratricopeptide (TPR) repeat protein